MEPIAKRRTRSWLCCALLLPFTGVVARGDAATTSLGREAPFLAENDAAMNRMMDGMAVKPTGDVDADFAAMMIPHHQGAIDMAAAELRHGHNEQLRRIAQEIIVDQLQEIAAMRIALGQPLPPSTPAPTGPKTAAPTVSPPLASRSPSAMHMGTDQ